MNKQIRLGDICSFQSGGTPSKNVPEFFNGKIPWITTAALNSRQIDEKNAVEWITEEAIIKSAAKVVPPFSIMVGTRVGVGKIAINTVPMSTSQDVVSMIGIDEKMWSKRYLCVFLRAKAEYLKSQSRGATIKGIKIETLSDLHLDVVPLKRQNEIADTIEKIETVIIARKHQLMELDTLVKARFVEMFGDLADPNCQHPKCKLIETCADIDDIKCGPFGTQLNKEEYQENGIAVWEIPQINSGFAEKPTHFLTDEKAKELSAYSLTPGDIAMSRKGNVGRCGLFPDKFEPGIIHSDVLRIRVDKKRVNPCFMMCQLHFSRNVQHQIEMVSSGAIMAGVNVTKLKQIYVHVPDFSLQERFADFVAQVDKSKVVVQKALDEAQTLFDSLMQKYFE